MTKSRIGSGSILARLSGYGFGGYLDLECSPIILDDIPFLRQNWFIC